MQNSAVRLKAIKTGGNSLNPPASMTLNLLSGAISSLVTFTRATTATVTDFEGLIKNTKSGEARFDGMRRVENLLTYSQDLSNAAWGRSNTTVAVDAITAPDGTLTADKVIESSDASAVVHQITASTFNSTVDNRYALSFFAKAAERSVIVLYDGSWTATELVKFDLISGTYTLLNFSQPIIASIVNVGGGWYRCSCSTIALATLPVTSGFNRFRLSNGTTTSYVGNGTSGLYIWGAQLENVTGQANQNPSEYVSTNAIRRNLLTYSQELNNAAWNPNALTITANTAIAPDNTLTADTFNEGSTAAIHNVQQINFTYTSGVSYTMSVYAKASTATVIQLLHQSTAFGVNAYANFDLVNGVLGTVGSSASVTMTPEGNGWYRCTLTAVATSTVSGQSVGFIFLCNNLTNAARALSYTGANNELYAWGAQLEVGSTATAYQLITDANPQNFNNYQGAGVDGVQYFPYTNPNCIINGAITQIPTIAINSDNSKFAYNCVASGDYFSTPNATANQITGDISLLVQVALDDWTPATVQTLVAKDGVTSQRSWAFNVQSSGALRLNYSLDGSTITSVTSTASTGFTDGTVHFVGVQREAATGIVRFYTSEDGTTFTQLGTDQTGTAGSLFNSNTSVQFGNLSSLAFELNGKIYDSHVYTGLKFSGNTLGSELATANYTTVTGFDNVTTNISASSFSTTAGTGAASRVYLNITTVTNTTCVVTYTSNVGATLGVYGRDGTGGGGTILATNTASIGTNSFSFVATSTTSNLLFVATPASAFTITDVSIKQVTPNTATASSTMVMDFDPSNWTSGTSFTGLETGEVWTLNGNAKIYQGLWDAVGPKSLLIEEARTNLFLQSGDFSNVAWGKTNATITADTAIAPDGTLTADKLTDGATNAFHFTFPATSLTVTNATVYTFSVYLKQGTNRYAGIHQNTGTPAGCSVDLQTGTLGTPYGGATAVLTVVGGGWYRLIVTVASASVVNIPAIYLSNSNSLASYIGTGTNIYIWGAQLEAGSFATSYIPTTSAQVTRNAEQAIMTGTNFSSWFNQTEGTVYADGDTNTSVSAKLFYRIGPAGVGSVGPYGNSTNVIFDKNGTGPILTFGSALTASVSTKTIMAYSSAGISAAINGGTVQSTATTVGGSGTALYIGTETTGPTNMLNGHIRTIRYYSQRLPNTTLQSLTA